jgi:hypothetical protein
VRYVGYKRYVFITPSAEPALAADELLDADAEVDALA